MKKQKKPSFKETITKILMIMIGIQIVTEQKIIAANEKTISKQRLMTRYNFCFLLNLNESSIWV